MNISQVANVTQAVREKVVWVSTWGAAEWVWYVTHALFFVCIVIVLWLFGDDIKLFFKIKLEKLKRWIDGKK